MQTIEVVKIEGFKVFFSDGEVVRKDSNNIWIYKAFLRQKTQPWQLRRWIKDENGHLDLEFPEI